MSLSGFDRVRQSLPEKQRELALRYAAMRNRQEQANARNALLIAAIWLTTLLCVLLFGK